ncbi:hypothetical protein [Streptomyces blattellae]|uniref:hypothetical protein n=1 Tax=Streptomyces blattellae TaxID=2569855 RepID=UPI0012B89DCA|nr:hypothetical protein [Streptomyces blattellae]
MDLLYLAFVRRPRRTRVRGQQQGRYGDDGGGEASGVTLGGVGALEHGDLTAAVC